MLLPTFNKKRRQVNLLPRDAFEQSLLGTILTWALTFGKWAVIITQLVVTSVFLVRFGYDRQLTDLRKNIVKQVTIIKSYEEVERDFRLAQQRVDYLTPLLEEQKLYKTLISKLQKASPVDVWLERLTISPNSASIVANAGSITGFGQFLRSVSNDEFFRSVTINSLQDGSKERAQLKFDMSLSFGKAEVKK